VTCLSHDEQLVSALFFAANLSYPHDITNRKWVYFVSIIHLCDLYLMMNFSLSVHHFFAINLSCPHAITNTRLWVTIYFYSLSCVKCQSMINSLWVIPHFFQPHSIIKCHFITNSLWVVMDVKNIRSNSILCDDKLQGVSCTLFLLPYNLITFCHQLVSNTPLFKLRSSIKSHIITFK